MTADQKKPYFMLDTKLVCDRDSYWDPDDIRMVLTPSAYCSIESMVMHLTSDEYADRIDFMRQDHRYSHTVLIPIEMEPDPVGTFEREFNAFHEKKEKQRIAAQLKKEEAKLKRQQKQAEANRKEAERERQLFLKLQKKFGSDTTLID